MSDSTRSGGKRPSVPSATDKTPHKRPRSNSTSMNATLVHPNRGSDMFADFDFRSKPQVVHSSKSSSSDVHEQKKKPTFKVPNAKELMDAFSSPMAGLSTAKAQPKLPPRSSISIHDQLLLRKPTVPVSPLRTENGGFIDTRNGKKGKERQMTPLRAPQPVYPADKNVPGNAKEKTLVTPITSRTYKLDTTPARKVMPLNSLFGLPKAETGFPSSSSASVSLTTSDDALRPLPGPKFSFGGGTKVPKTPLRGVTPAPFEVLAKLEDLATSPRTKVLLRRGVTPAPFEVLAKLEDQFSAGGEDEDEHTRELNRGLLVSPEKEGGRGRKFVRNGLAERAQHLIARSRTAFTLWSKELESLSRPSSAKSTPSSALAASSIRHRPDIRLQLLSISHISRSSNIHSRSSGSSLRSVLAGCLILSGPPELRSLTVSAVNNEITTLGQSGTPAGVLGDEVQPASRANSQTLQVLLSFHAHEQSDFALHLLGRSEGRDGSDIIAGCEVHVWKPWYTTSASPSPSTMHDRTEEDTEEVQEEEGDVFSTPSKRSKFRSTAMKLPPSILCSRFLVIPPELKIPVPT